MGSFFQKAIKVLGAAVLINGLLLSALAVIIGSAYLIRNLIPKQDTSSEQQAATVSQSRFANMSAEQLFEQAQRVAEIALGDGEYFRKAKTADEAFPGVYGAKHVPPYWAKIEDEFELARYLGVNTVPNLPTYESLTRNERLTFCYTNDGESFIELRYPITKRFSDFILNRENLFAGQYSAGVLEWRLDELPNRVSSNLNNLTKKDALEWIDGLYPEPILSPLTNLLMRADCREFKPGQAFVEYHFKDDVWNQLWPKYIQRPGTNSPDELLDIGFIYYRFYGEHAVIAEGVWAWDGAGSFSRISEMPKPGEQKK